MKKTPDQLLAEIATVKESLKVSAATLVQLSTELYNQSRRVQTASASAYVTTANGWMRFAGMVTQGIRRADLTDRQVVRAKEIEAQEAEIMKEREIAQQRRTAQRQAQMSSVDDLVALYGEEMILNASK
jgi:hypothetical protein